MYFNKYLIVKNINKKAMQNGIAQLLDIKILFRIYR